jgi:cold-inducible RNA-binding protein
MAYKLFVGSLSWNTDDKALQDAFAQFGNVASATVIKDRESGRSKGFGFVEFETEDEGKAAIKEMNGKELDGREITVNEARPREERPRRDFGGNGQGGGNRDSFRKKSW